MVQDRTIAIFSLILRLVQQCILADPKASSHPASYPLRANAEAAQPLFWLPRLISRQEFFEEPLIDVECLFWYKPQFQNFEHCDQPRAID
jgi:hypothetical protein